MAEVDYKQRNRALHQHMLEFTKNKISDLKALYFVAFNTSKLTAFCYLCDYCVIFLFIFRFLSRARVDHVL